MTSYKERSVLHFLKRWYPKAFIKYNETRISTRNTSKIIYRQEMMATYFQGTYFSEELEDNENENYTASLVMRFDIESQCGKKLKHRNKILTLIRKINPHQLLETRERWKELENKFEPGKELSDEEKNEVHCMKQTNLQKLKVLDFLTYCCKIDNLI